MRRWLTLFYTSLFFAGCTENDVSVHLADEISLNELPKNQENQDQKTIDAILLVLANTPDCQVTSGFAGSNCEPVRVSFQKKKGRNFSNRQRVLVIDSGMWTESLLTLSSRVLDVVVPDEFGRLRTAQLSGVFSRGAQIIFSEIIGQNPQISWHTLKNEGKEISKKLINPFPGEETTDDHGFDILSTIAELSPDAEFVISQTPHHSSSAIKESFCDFTSNSESLQRIQGFYRTLAREHLRLIREYGIRFINLSSGHTLRNIKSEFAHCGDKIANNKNVHKQFLNLLFEEYYKPLGTIDGVALVQAGVLSSFRVLSIDDEEYPIDCVDLPNRIRVGEISYSKYSTEPKVSKDQSNALACIDVVINKGPRDWDMIDAIFDGTFSRWEEVYCASKNSLFPCQLGTSYTAPLMVSYLIFLSEKEPELPLEKIIQRLRNEGPEIIRDPGANGEFMRFVRDGRRYR